MEAWSLPVQTRSVTSSRSNRMSSSVQKTAARLARRSQAGVMRYASACCSIGSDKRICDICAQQCVIGQHIVADGLFTLGHLYSSYTVDTSLQAGVMLCLQQHSCDNA